MNVGLAVITPGVHTTVQDFGRPGFQQFGVPVSGALDNVSLRLANGLVGNSRNTAGLEILYRGPILEVAAERVNLAVGGFGASIKLLRTVEDRVPAWQTVSLEHGAQFEIVLGDKSNVCYLAIEGGLDLPPALGSLSTYTRSGLGGYKGRPLAKGDIVPLKLRSVRSKDPTGYARFPASRLDNPIRCSWGIQTEYFTERSLQSFLSEPFMILPESDRMGYRLLGPRMEHVGGYDIISDGVAAGAIQVPGNGNPIVLLADRQTTGGYPKIANIISADLPAMGRCRPGQKIRFEIIDVEEAEHIRRAQEFDLQIIERSISPVSSGGAVDLGALYIENLISGVVGGHEGLD